MGTAGGFSLTFFLWIGGVLTILTLLLKIFVTFSYRNERAEERARGIAKQKWGLLDLSISDESTSVWLDWGGWRRSMHPKSLFNIEASVLTLETQGVKSGGVRLKLTLPRNHPVVRKLRTLPCFQEVEFEFVEGGIPGFPRHELSSYLMVKT